MKPFTSLQFPLLTALAIVFLSQASVCFGNSTPLLSRQEYFNHHYQVRDPSKEWAVWHINESTPPVYLAHYTTHEGFYSAMNEGIFLGPNPGITNGAVGGYGLFAEFSPTTWRSVVLGNRPYLLVVKLKPGTRVLDFTQEHVRSVFGSTRNIAMSGGLDNLMRRYGIDVVIDAELDGTRQVIVKNRDSIEVVRGREFLANGFWKVFLTLIKNPADKPNSILSISEIESVLQEINLYAGHYLRQWDPSGYNWAISELKRIIETSPNIEWGLHGDLNQFRLLYPDQENFGKFVLRVWGGFLKQSSASPMPPGMSTIQKLYDSLPSELRNQARMQLQSTAIMSASSVHQLEQGWFPLLNIGMDTNYAQEQGFPGVTELKSAIVNEFIRKSGQTPEFHQIQTQIQKHQAWQWPEAHDSFVENVLTHSKYISSLAISDRNDGYRRFGRILASTVQTHGDDSARLSRTLDMMLSRVYFSNEFGGFLGSDLKLALEDKSNTSNGSRSDWAKKVVAQLKEGGAFDTIEQVTGLFVRKDSSQASPNKCQLLF